MITLKCHKCQCLLGEIQKGKLKKNTFLYCKECQEKISTKDIADRLANLGKDYKRSNSDLKRLFKELFK